MGIRQQAVHNGVAQFATRQHSYVENGETKTIDISVPVMTGDTFQAKAEQSVSNAVVTLEGAIAASQAFLKQNNAERAAKALPQLEALRAFNQIGKVNSGLDLTVAQIREQAKLAVADKAPDGSSQLTQSAVVRDKNNGIV